MWGNLVPPLFVRIFTVLNKARAKNKGYERVSKVHCLY